MGGSFLSLGSPVALFGPPDDPPRKGLEVARNGVRQNSRCPAHLATRARRRSPGSPVAAPRGSAQVGLGAPGCFSPPRLRRQRQGGLRDAGARLRNHHPSTPTLTSRPTCRTPRPRRWRRRWEPDRDLYPPLGLEYGCSKRAGNRIPARSLPVQNTALCRDFCCGRCWVRTSDLLLVREALYP